MMGIGCYLLQHLLLGCPLPCVVQSEPL
jgi:hypothetical protein